MNFIKKELKDYKNLLRAIPSIIITLFVVSVIAMNLLANKELFSSEYFALDCGFALSWISYLCMDIICKRCGAKAATKISIFALVINLVLCGIFKLLCMTPGSWGEFYTFENSIVNDALNNTFGGTWYVILGSSVAMLISALVNSILNAIIGKRLKNKSYKDFAVRSFISTGIAQFVDNLVFATMVSKIFFGWSWTAVLMCSLTGAIAELLCEVIFSPIGYRVSKQWEKENVGKDYLEAKN